MKFREIKRLLEKNGWYHDRTKGSHYIFRNSELNEIVSVPNHNGDIPIGTAKSILKQANIKEDK